MARLADYFVIVGYDHDKERTGNRTGKILQRFPENDWPDTPFIEGIEWFCQPLGWALSTERQEPKYFVSVLTDIDANRHYCACLCFNETVSITPSKPVDEEEENLSNNGQALLTTTPTITHHSIMYAPKCFVLVSRLDYTETFRNCLGTIYTVYIESLPYPLETLIGNILGCIQVPPAGGPQVRFSIGCGDKQALQPPLSSTLPVTGTCVSFLFQQLGIRNVLLLYCAVMTEHKILFHSKSFSRLTQSCRALIALMYPFRYTHVYIPILPAPLAEVLSTPTPFIMGVHSSLQSEIVDLLDVIIADIDGGSIKIPESLVPPVSILPQQIWDNVQNSLTIVLQPHLNTADLAFVSQNNSTMKSDSMLDKEIRAVFMRMFAQLLQGYRSCLTLIRIHPKPVITFHKAGFLGARDLVNCDFLSRVLDSMFFTGFVSERGPPWRPCDAWDELYSAITDLLRTENQDSKLTITHIQELAQILYTNENPNSQVYTQKILKPPDGAYSRIHQPPMNPINGQQVQAIINEGLNKNDLQSRFQTIRQPPRIVPMGPHLQSISDGRPIVNNTARRLEVLRSCVNFIFENKIADARKSFPAVMRTLKQRDARLTLCRELARTVQGNKAMLEHQQFDLVVKLMNRALQDDSTMDEHGVAAALLPLSTAFCRKLCTGVIQFAYTCIQDHPVWKNQQFWEAAFYQDVQTQIKALYLPRIPIIDNNYTYWRHENGKLSPSNSRDLMEYRSSILSRVQEPSALEIAAEQMRIWPSMESKKQQELIISEESTLYSQAIHYANRMVALLIPPDVNCGGKVQKIDHHFDDDTSVSNSVVESRSHSEHSDEGFEESDPGETGNVVAKMVCRFIDRVCTEGSVTPEHVRNLHAMVPGVVHMHIETLDAVHRESKRIPPVQKPKIHTPSLLTGEEILGEPMRVYLFADGREEGQSPLLPAEGALFLTNYRVVFRGSPCDPLACEQSIVRTFPVSSLIKEKRISVLYLPHLDQVLQEGLQIRSCTFQLMKVAFDEEVTAENIEAFRKLLNKARHPANEFGHFAFASYGIVAHQTQNYKVKEKSATLKGLAKKTLLRTAKKAGFKQKGTTKRKYILSGVDFEDNGMTNTTGTGTTTQSTSIGGSGIITDNNTSNNNNNNNSNNNNNNNDDDDDSDENVDTMPRVTVKDVERLKERSYVRDWKRLGFGDPQSNYRISSTNCNYSLCRSYPAIILSPLTINDDSLRNLARCYKGQRIPLATWRHRNGAILLRGATPHTRGVMGMLKGHPSSANTSNDLSGSGIIGDGSTGRGGGGGVGGSIGGSSAGGSSGSFQEQDRYFITIIENMPHTMTISRHAWGLSDSNLSINSLLLAAEDHQYHHNNHHQQQQLQQQQQQQQQLAYKNEMSSTLTPDINRKTTNAFNNTVRSFQNFAGRQSNSSKNTKWGSLKTGVTSGFSNSNQHQNHQLRDINEHRDHHHHHHHHYAFQRVPLYILGEKSQSKSVRLSELYTEFVPVDYTDVRHSRIAFKKLMRACLPSSVNIEPDQSFAKLLEQSDWLQQIRGLLQLSGAVVDLLDLQGSSVTLALEDGWDVTAQVSALAQLCLDPYYRTIEGFRVLIEKEWIAFGHRFGHRSNLKSHSSSGSPFAPTFLQFLDAVYQIHAQFPLAFEFNEFYLRFIAYHSVSCRFRTFLFDCELERFDLGIATIEDKRGSLNSKHVVETCTNSDDDNIYPGGIRNSNSLSHKIGYSIFDYIERQHVKSPIFYNFMYTLDPDRQVLRPQSSVAVLELWRYYVDEELAQGPPYDPELVGNDNLDDESEFNVSKQPKRKVITVGYDSVDKCDPDIFTRLLDELKQAEAERGLLPQKYRQVWDKLELPHSDSLTRHASFSSALVRSHGRLLHKRSTLEIIMRGRLSGHHQESFSHPHRFEKHSYTTPTHCSHCDGVLWGPMWTGLRCMDCGNSYHEKCSDSVPKNCTKYKAVEGVSQQTLTRSQGDNGSIASSANTGQTSSQHFYEQFSSNVAENRTHEGHLYKRGHLLKGWKQRWFVLDSIKHQLRYYDAMEDSNFKGFIDLAEVQSVQLAPPAAQVGTKKIDEKAFFDLKTCRRTYNFYALDASMAQEWIEKIQACLQ